VDSKLNPELKNAREQRKHELYMRAISEFASVSKVALASPMLAWLSGKLVLKGIVDPLNIGDVNTRTGINQAFDALAVAQATSSLAKEVLPILPLLAKVGA
jgi:hypothetical protein